jgi:hypothetical protein
MEKKTIEIIITPYDLGRAYSLVSKLSFEEALQDALKKHEVMSDTPDSRECFLYGYNSVY